MAFSTTAVRISAFTLVPGMRARPSFTMEQTTSPTCRDPSACTATGFLSTWPRHCPGQCVPGDGHELSDGDAAEFRFVDVDANPQSIHAPDIGDEVAGVQVGAKAH